jgi:UrcA family protein
MRPFYTRWAQGALRLHLITAMTGACLCTLVLVTAIPNVAAAQTMPDITVHYGDLDLTSTTGAATLHRRLEIAVRKVCMRAPGIETITGYSAARICRSRKWQEIDFQQASAVNSGDE